MRWILDYQLNEVKHAKVRDYFRCPETFKYREQICLELLLYPNGYNQNEQGNVNIFFHAKCSANLAPNLNIKYYVKCIETNTEWKDCVHFDHKHNNHQLINKLSINHLQSLNTLSFICKCTFQILSTSHSKQTYTPQTITKTTKKDQNSSNLVWDITWNQLQNLFKIPAGSWIYSPQFVHNNLDWRMHCYPNGKKNYFGDFTVDLELMHMSSHIHSFRAIISLFIPNTNTRCFKQYVFRQKNEKYAGTDSVLLIPSGYLPVHSLVGLNDSLRIIVSVQIRKINFLSNDKSVGIMHLCDAHKIKLSKQVSYEWQLSSKQLKIMQMSQINGIWASELFDSCWYLVFAPNGRSMSSKGICKLSLCLLEFPSDFSVMTANILLKCNEYEWRHTAAFKYRPHDGRECTFSSWADDVLGFNDFCKMDKVSFVCEIEIIAIYDRNGYEFDNDAYKQSLSGSTRRKREQKVRYLDDLKEEKDETPGYELDEGEECKDMNRQNVELKNEIKSLQKQMVFLMTRIKKLEQRQINDGNNGNGIVSFKEWYKCKIQLPEYYDLFIKEGYDSVCAFLALTDLDLTHLGVAKKGHRVKILKIIRNYL